MFLTNIITTDITTIYNNKIFPIFSFSGFTFTNKPKANSPTVNPENAAKNVKALGKVSEKQAAKIMAGLRETDPSGVLSREFGKLYGISKGTTGKRGDMAKAMDDMGPRGVLAMRLSEGNKLLGPLHTRSLSQLMATESMQGLSGEQLKEMQQVSRAMYGNWDQLKDAQKTQTAEQKEAAKIAKDGGPIEAGLKAQIDAYGAYIDLFPVDYDPFSGGKA